MNKILDKLGVYDLIAVLLSGISISTFSVLVLQFVYKFPIDINLQVNETLSFLVLSYFLGLVFQEISSFIQKKSSHKNNGLLKSALKTQKDSHIFLTEIEKMGVYSYVINKLNLNPNENNDNVIYNYCKFYIIESGDTTRIDREQSISAMSRSFSLYFALLTILVLINIFFQPEFTKVVLVGVSLFFTFLFYYRCIRFTKLRYINIFRTFYYNVVTK